jgi:single-strand DNA-binding protein
MNQIIMEGNIGKDPELKWSGEMAIAKFSLAHTPRKKDKSNVWSDGETIWFNVTFFGSKAESVIDNYVKGETVLIVGAFEISNYEKDGVAKTSFGIVGSTISAVKRRKKEAPAW